MIDPAQRLLLETTSNCEGRFLWLADESALEAIALLANFKASLTVMSNRFDVYQAARKAGFSALFSDWDLSQISQFDAIGFRVCKEKPVNRHLINSALTTLTMDGTLYLTGEKNDGIKSLAKEVGTLFKHSGSLKKNGNVYLGQYRHAHSQAQSAASDYQRMEVIATINNLDIFSKKGVYGWNKIDQGSALLIDQFNLAAASWDEAGFASLLDLGCGYGYLTLTSAQLPFRKRVATDNNAAALQACQFNATHNRLDVEVIAADCAKDINQTFSRILCNPPFHRGFDTRSDLTDQFLSSAQQHLQPRGQAFFVVNSFIGIEDKARKYFGVTETLVNNGQFKVIRCG